MIVCRPPNVSYGLGWKVLSVVTSSVRSVPRYEGGAVLIDCDSCAVRGIECPDCVITALLGEPPRDVILDPEERRAIAVLADSGLVPPLRLTLRTDRLRRRPDGISESA